MVPGSPGTAAPPGRALASHQQPPVRGWCVSRLSGVSESPSAVPYVVPGWSRSPPYGSRWSSRGSVALKPAAVRPYPLRDAAGPSPAVESRGRPTGLRRGDQTSALPHLSCCRRESNPRPPACGGRSGHLSYGCGTTPVRIMQGGRHSVLRRLSRARACAVLSGGSCYQRFRTRLSGCLVFCLGRGSYSSDSTVTRSHPPCRGTGRSRTANLRGVPGALPLSYSTRPLLRGTTSVAPG